MDPEFYVVLSRFQQEHTVSCMTSLAMLVNHQIKHQATHNMDSQPGDCRWLFNLPLGFVSVCTGNIPTLLHPRLISYKTSNLNDRTHLPELIPPCCIGFLWTRVSLYHHLFDSECGFVCFFLCLLDSFYIDWNNCHRVEEIGAVRVPNMRIMVKHT